MNRIWIKLYLEILDDPKMGRLANHLWRRVVECFLLAGRHGDDGVLPPVEEMACTLHLPREKVLEDLRGLEEAGVVHEETPEDESVSLWVVTHFKERQVSDSSERVRRYRARYKLNNGRAGGNAEVAGDSSSASISGSESVSPLGEGSGEGALVIPDSPRQAMQHPDLRIYSQVTSGRIPGRPQYAQVIDAVRLLRERKGLDDAGLQAFLGPYWAAWTGRRRRDGRPYDRGSLAWLTEWAINESIPQLGYNSQSPADVSAEAEAHDSEVIRQVARKRK